MPFRSTRPARPLILAIAAGAMLGGCAGRSAVRSGFGATAGGRDVPIDQAFESPPKPAMRRDGFPEGWELPEETAAPRKVGATAAVPVAAASSTISTDSDLAKAGIQVRKAELMLGRLKGTGYQLLVKDDIAAIEGLLDQARGALASGNAPETRRLADESALKLQKAKTRIEAETQQPLRW